MIISPDTEKVFGKLNILHDKSPEEARNRERSQVTGQHGIYTQ
jgi:hypothetical protein